MKGGLWQYRASCLSSAWHDATTEREYKWCGRMGAMPTMRSRGKQGASRGEGRPQQTQQMKASTARIAASWRNKVHPGTNWYCPGKTLSRRQTKLTSRQKNGMHVGIAAGRNTRTRENLKNTRHPRKFYGVGQTWEGWQTDRHGIISYEDTSPKVPTLMPYNVHAIQDHQ